MNDNIMNNNPINLSDSLLSIKGVGEKTYKNLVAANISSINDMLHFYPRDYDKLEELTVISDLSVGIRSVVKAQIVSNVFEKKSGRMTITSCYIADSSGKIEIVYFNAPFMKKKLKKGEIFCFRGRTVQKGNRITLNQPTVLTMAEYESKKSELNPIYPLHGNLKQHILRKISFSILQDISDNSSINDYMPKEILQTNHLLALNDAIKNIHFPSDYEMLIQARKRLCFDEFLSFILSMKLMKNKDVSVANQFRMISVAETTRIIEGLPYRLTSDQNKVWAEIEKDLTGTSTMNRLLQGDVGSGKTIIAFLSLILAAANGYQSVLMAPTEVLAMQHYNALNKLCSQHQFPFKITLLSGSMTAKERRERYQSIEEGSSDIIIGTHAVFQEKVIFHNLALAITDEQHRFGVKQRESLAQKTNNGKEPHILVMSATPIPRTLAIILYGDLDVSLIKEKPSERLPIKNCVVDESYRPNAYKFFEKQISLGRQVFVICPMIENSDEDEGFLSSDLENVISYKGKLESELPDYIRIDILHGKMKNAQKNEIMNRFLHHDIDILISTTVIEVGINVPNATVMMVENAERFGLAQLHQLRGRVGRGGEQSYCIFINTSKSETSRKRLEVLNSSNDGFYIAEQDLKLRGPGDMMGTRQSGEMSFFLADIYQDSDMLMLASKVADDLIEMAKNKLDIQDKISLFLDNLGIKVDFPTI